MTTLANRSFAFFGAIVDVMEATIAMSNAVRRENPAAGDVKKLRAIADTL